MRPLEGLLVLDFAQFLAAPSAALWLADLGARVIKIERPGVGELGRQLYISNLELGNLLDCDELSAYTDSKTWFTKRDDIKAILARHLQTRTTAYWLARLEPADYWCAEVLRWDNLLAHEGFTTLQMIQNVNLKSGKMLKTLRCPIRVDGEILFANKGAPKVGEDNERILQEIGVSA